MALLYYGIIFYKTSIRVCLQSIISPFAPWFNHGRIEGREKRKGLWHCPILLFLQQTNMWTPAFQFQLQTRNILANFPMIIRCNRVAIQDNNKSKYEIVPILGSKQVSSSGLQVSMSQAPPSGSQGDDDEDRHVSDVLPCCLHLTLGCLSTKILSTEGLFKDLC